jgi:hypothetical protein
MKLNADARRIVSAKFLWKPIQLKMTQVIFLVRFIETKSAELRRVYRIFTAHSRRDKPPFTP